MPAEVSLIYNKTTKQYEFHATYVTQPKRTEVQSGTVVAVDLGEIHPIVAFDGIYCEIYNGREHRSKSRYREKSKGASEAVAVGKNLNKRKIKRLQRCGRSYVTCDTKSRHALFLLAESER